MKLVAAPLALSIIVACGSSSSEPYQSCDSLAASAQSDMQTAIAQNASCAVDADCTSVGFRSDCFDSCTRAAAASGTAAIDAARDTVNAKACQTFVSEGCKLVIPPCAPPQTPKCNKGTCE